MGWRLDRPQNICRTRIHRRAGRERRLTSSDSENCKSPLDFASAASRGRQGRLFTALPGFLHWNDEWPVAGESKWCRYDDGGDWVSDETFKFTGSALSSRCSQPPGFCQIPTPSSSSVWAALLVVLLVSLFGGCRSQITPTGPAIEFTKIPPAAQGGRERVDVISGRVVGAAPGQRIVVYARSGPWWVQPWPDKPFITIQPDHTWSTPTHLGFEYAALLVDPGYEPPPTTDVAPTPGGSVVAVETVKGVGAIQLAPTKPIKFSGYDWNVSTIAGDRGGLNNLYAGDNAWTDDSGALHLRINKRAGRWVCAEVEAARSLGYGTYITVVRDTSRLEPAAILSIDTFD